MGTGQLLAGRAVTLLVGPWRRRWRFRYGNRILVGASIRFRGYGYAPRLTYRKQGGEGKLERVGEIIDAVTP